MVRRDLALHEVQDVRRMSTSEYLRGGCARAFSVASTYLPVLCDMAEKYLKLTAPDRIRKSYAMVLSDDGTWLVRCSDGYEERIGRGEGAKAACIRLVERLNGIV